VVRGTRCDQIRVTVADAMIDTVHRAAHAGTVASRPSARRPAI
jgi:hypothetical protein